MFRSAAYSLLTLAIVMVGFYAYWRFQPAIPLGTEPAAHGNVSASALDETQMKIGPGKRAWAKSFDDKGHLSSLFTASEFTPQKDRSFKVVNPVSVFYLDDGQYMVVTGESGIIFADSTGGAAPTDTSPVRPPNIGLLQHVHIKFYPSQSAERPTLWIDMNNARFDNITLRLYTQSYTDESGVTIPADRVPVTVRGDDYEFDGEGLTLRWDDRDHRLQLLEIAHGRRLEIKNPAKLSAPGSPLTPSAAVVPLTPVELVDAAPDAAALAVPGPSKVRATPYRAVFHNDVRIDQGDLQVASADTLTVDFIQHGPKTPAAAASHPIADEYVEPTVPVAAQKIANAPGQAATAPVTAPATTQPNPPITVYWTGKLRVTPLEGDPILPVIPGQAAARLVGVPVRLTPKGSVVTAAAAVYRSGDCAARLENSPAIPQIELTQERMHFTADTFDYDPATSLATIGGRSVLDMTTEDNQPLKASWRDQGIIHVIAKNGQPSTIDHADLKGHVIVNHPRFNLTSSNLALDLEKSGPDSDKKGGVTLKRATATGNAICKLTENGQGQRQIDSDRLVIDTVPGPDGKPTPRSIVADGSVKAFDPDQTLTAGHLEALLKPKPQAAAQNTKSADTGEAMDLESMYAHSKVHAVLKNGTVANADELRVNTKNGHQEVELRGQLATVDDGKGGTLRGPIIRVLPDESSLSVDGPGTMTTVRKSTTQPVVVAWSNSLNVDGPANTVDVRGNVKEHTFEANGTEDTMISDSAHADLVPVPAAEKSPTTQSADSDFGGKKLKALTLLGNVHGISMLKAADQSTLRHGEIWGSKLTYDADSGRATIPGAGHLLTENHKPAGAAQPVADQSGLGSNFGDLVMQWQKSLVYDPNDRKVVFDGNVDAWFQQDVKDAGIMKLKSQSITAFLEPATTTRPATTAQATPAMQLSHITANGSADTPLNFTAKTLDFNADNIDYDPKTDLMTAHGTDLQPAELHDEDGSKRTFKELIFNVKSQIVESATGLKGDLRK